ncbi:MAG TPA: type II secretion system protein G [Moraxellaceae bacterium]|nr:type II secretion system protein G [Moraxellaceae bacterium]
MNTRKGFTLIELLVVLTIIGSLLTIVAPRFFQQMDKGREAVLRQNLYALRSSIDKYYGDKGAYPAELRTLVTAHYLREIPVDPFTSSNQTWQLTRSADTDNPGIADIHSGATGAALDGTRLADW